MFHTHTIQFPTSVKNARVTFSTNITAYYRNPECYRCDTIVSGTWPPLWATSGGTAARLTNDSVPAPPSTVLTTHWYLLHCDIHPLWELVQLQTMVRDICIGLYNYVFILLLDCPTGVGSHLAHWAWRRAVSHYLLYCWTDNKEHFDFENVLSWNLHHLGYWRNTHNSQ